jgi:membrane associated rhomboid family serine protease
VDPAYPTAPPACYRHPDRPTRLSCSNCGRPICVECSRDAVVGQKCPECTTPEHRTRVIPARTITHANRRVAPVTLALIAINVVVFLIGQVSSTLENRLFNDGAQAVHLVSSGQWWRVFTAMFLHANWLHILFNMYALWLFGPVLERRFGSFSYAALYLAAGTTAGMLFQLIGTGAAVGASGAIFGLLGALLAASYRQRHTRAGAAVFGQLGILLAINLALPIFVPNIAWQGHVGGLLGGILIAAIWDRLPLAGRTAEWRRVAVALAVGAAAMAVVLFF